MFHVSNERKKRRVKSFSLFFKTFIFIVFLLLLFFPAFPFPFFVISLLFSPVLYFSLFCSFFFFLMPLFLISLLFPRLSHFFTCSYFLSYLSLFLSFLLSTLLFTSLLIFQMNSKSHLYLILQNKKKPPSFNQIFFPFIFGNK